MALSTYAELLSSITDWMARSDVSGNAADFVTLGEAHLNRELNPVESDVTLTGTASSNIIDVSAYSVVEPLALFIEDSAGNETELRKMRAGQFRYTTTENAPSVWALDGTDIKFDCPLDSAYEFRFRYRGRFALSDSVTTNWLLTNHPDAYLAASIVWGSVYVQNSNLAAGYNALLDEAIPAIRNIIAQKNRGTLVVDDALLPSRSFTYADWASDV